MQRHQSQRLRHETRRRAVTVTSVTQLTPCMKRIDFTCDDFADFVSASPDDHIKLFFPSADRPGERPCMRDFTPRRFDVASGTLTIHDAGPAMAWARAAKTGDMLEIGGPRGSMIVADDFDWYLLIGDQTALPAIGRRLEETRPGVPVTTIVLLDDPADAQVVATQADWTPHWVIRGPDVDDAAAIVAALDGAGLRDGEGFVWIAAESTVARTARHYLIDRLGHSREWINAAGYWAKGQADAHERIED